MNKLFQAVLSYLLHMDFSAATPATLSDGQVLDTAGEGSVLGSLTIVDTSAATLEIGGGTVRTSVQYNNNTYTTLGGSGAALATATGRVFMAKLSMGPLAANTNEFLCGLKTASGVNLTGVVASIYGRGSSTGLVQFYSGSQTSLFTSTANIIYDCAIVMLADGWAYFFKGGAFPVWTLIAVDASNTPAGNVYPFFVTGYTLPGLGKLAVTDTLYPTLVQPIISDDFSEANGTALNGKAIDIGGVWTRIYTSGNVTATVESGAATLTTSDTTGGQEVFVSDEVGVSDIVAVSTVTTPSTTGNRMNVHDLRCDALFNTAVQTTATPASGTSGSIDIYERTAGVSTSRASTTGSLLINTTYHTQTRLVGASAYLTIGGLSISATLATPTTLGRHGFAVYDKSTANASSKIDNFKVYPATALQVSNTTVAEDDFSEADGTALSGKAPDKGGNWSVIQTGANITATVSSGKGTVSNSSGTAQSFTAVTLTTASDVLVSADLVGDTNYYNVMARSNNIDPVAAGGDCVYAVIQPTNNSQTHTLYEGTNGSLASRGSLTASVPKTSVPVQLRVVGASAYLLIGTIGSISATLAVATTHKYHGFVLSDASGQTNPTIDNFKVYPFTEITDYDEVLNAI